MRILLLTALVGGLLWFFLRTPESAASASEGAGEMLPMEPESAASAPEGIESIASGLSPARAEGPPAEERPESVASEAPVQRAEPARDPAAVTPVLSSVTDAETARVASDSDSRALETRIAAWLFQDLDRYDAAIDSAASGMPPGRLELARTLGRVVRSPEGDRGALADRLKGTPGVLQSELAFLGQVGRPTGVETLLAAARPEGPLLQATRLALLVQEAERRMQGGESSSAIERLSLATIEALDGPWQLEPSTLGKWTELLSRGARDCVWTPKGAWKGVEVSVRPGDSLISLRKRLVNDQPELQVSTGLIARVNGLRGDRIHPGDVLRVPTEPVSMLVDLDSHWAFYLLGGRIVGGWPVGVGRQGKETQLGVYRVGDKRRDPMWFPAGQEPVPYGDPRNPLGTRWIELEHADGRASHLGFHGTNEPDSVGKDASEGCLRMHQADVEELFEILPAGVRVVIQA